ncbi:hypothetical protein STEG23_017750, partial [Scotinomys teguina]
MRFMQPLRRVNRDSSGLVKESTDEFHSRLRFNRRGLVAMANAGPHDNGSQFFFTLGRADELNNKHTIFGKVTGDTVYNMLRLTEVDIDDDERPRNPHRVKSCEVLFNPFDDIIPREMKRPERERPEEESKKLRPKGTKNFSLLSFGEEAEEEEEEVNRVSQSMKGRSKSSHDLLKDDPHLSSVPAVESEKDVAAGDLEDDGEDDSAEQDEYIDGDEKNLVRERIAKRLRKDTSADVKSAGEGEGGKKPTSRRDTGILVLPQTHCERIPVLGLSTWATSVRSSSKPLLLFTQSSLKCLSERPSLTLLLG